jgi:hypothetical protein
MNQSKWKAARKWAEKRGMEFIILTEKELDIPSKSYKYKRNGTINKTNKNNKALSRVKIKETSR